MAFMAVSGSVSRRGQMGMDELQRDGKAGTPPRTYITPTRGLYESAGLCGTAGAGDKVGVKLFRGRGLSI